MLPGAEILGRAAAAAGLGFVFPPLALLPTIQLGVGDDSRCSRAVQAVNENPAAGIAPGSLSHAVGTKGSVAPASPHHATGSHKRTSGKASATKQHEGRMTPAEVRAAWDAKLKKQNKN
ncbi:lipopolysaccharide biogenesis periplasmic protein [Acetobacter malorum]|uniref:Lipopolysaccharide biogenesis periplasmic protein n=1 Tax=Acetobacter malorum TaxID=178901 RepID=A0A177FW58_9PROT|nr:lipopolysaccharide biogenesis periplasmic protein [Acetobacter malorum]